MRNLSELEIRHLKIRLDSLEKGMENLKEKKRRALLELGQKPEEESSGSTPEEIIEGEDKYKVLGVFYKCQKYKKDGTLGGQTRYIEVK